MGKVSKYEGKEKKYYVTKRKKINLKALFLLLILPAIISIILGLLFLNKGISSNAKDNEVPYKETGNIDYKVYLKDNNYFDQKVLPKDMKYIANLINTINVDFNYEMNSTEVFDYTYRYKINARLVITDKNDNNKVLYEKPYELLKETNRGVKDNNFVLNENIDIDYDEYNNYVDSLKKDYTLAVNSNLIVTMEIVTEGVSDKIEDKINTNNKLELSIPLSQQTLDITINSKDLNEYSSTYRISKFAITNYVFFVFGIIFCLIGLLLILLAIYLHVSSKKDKDIYIYTINKYLKEYDKMIVTSKRPNIDETNYKEVIRVTSIDELIDTHNITKQPIIYYEVIPGEKSYFIVISDELLYKLTISKAWLLKNK